MQVVDEPLNDHELDLLDAFLLKRVDEQVYKPGMDEGVLTISELDGFLTAIVSGPETVMPSRWLPAVWGDFEPEWKDEKQFERIMALIFRHMNGIVSVLINDPEAFVPIYLCHEVDGDQIPIVDEWCTGYARGVALAADAWETGGDPVADMLLPILAFTETMGGPAHDLPDGKALEKAHATITQSARAIHAHWLSRRAETTPSPARRNAPRPGRNDPCPCGSGKKYKKCCLQ